MLMNLFSVFDPTSYFGINLNWLIIYFVFFFIPLKYYLLYSGLQLNIKVAYLSVKDMFCDVSFPNYMMLTYMSVTTFIYLIFSNLLGLFPFIFTGTAHPMITMGFGIVMWISFFLMGWMKNFRSSAAHLVPEGSPFLLSPLLVLVESISHLIRPFTLSVRLAANMMAGHLIVGLLSSISLINLSSFSLSLFMQSALMVLEFGVAVIQGFVFSILLLLYALEYY